MKTTTFAVLSVLAGLVAHGARAESRIFAGIDFHSRPRLVAPVVVPSPTAFHPPAYAPLPMPRYGATRGYWRDVTVTNWVPERWAVSRDRRGRSVRVFEPGHYVYSTDRVWVDDRRDHHPARRMNRWNR